MSTSALEVDLKGLRLLVERRGKSFALMELVQNGWDEKQVTHVSVSLSYVPGSRALHKLIVEDDAPEGFADLTHAYTLFSPSKKKDNPEKRGRFNLGEKLVIALSTEFTVETTTGGVEIDVERNTRRTLRKRRDKGSRITAYVRMTKAEAEEALIAMRSLLPPSTIRTTINGEEITPRTALRTFDAILATEVADAEGFLRKTQRKTTVEVHEPINGEVGMLYEMGIPVVETGDTFHANILQKIPLNVDRDNVPPAFLKDVRALVLNEMATRMSKEAAQGNWVNEALEDPLVTSAAVEAILSKRFGEKRVIFDPSDQEANRIAMSQGYQVIPPRALSAPAWAHVREFGAALPAGRVTPSPKPFAENGSPLEVIDPKDYTKEENRFAHVVRELHKDIMGKDIHVRLTKDSRWAFGGCYGSGEIILKLTKHQPPDITDKHMLATVIHEFAHHYGSHLTHEFDYGMGLIAAEIANRIMANPMYLDDLERADG